MSSIVNIVPTTLSFEVSQIEITFEQFQLNAVSGFVYVRYCNNLGQIFKIEKVYIPSDVYQEWGQDDDFIINYVLEQLVLERQPL
jgi:hypothetical protein